MIYLIAALCVLITIGINRLIGSGKSPVPRTVLYVLSGITASALAYQTRGFSLQDCAIIGFIQAIGFALYRQPSPNGAFYAMHGNNKFPPKGNPLVNWIMDKIHKMPLTWVPTATQDQLIKYGTIYGTYRGLFIFATCILYSIFIYKYAFLFGFLGAFYGVICRLVGIKGPWKGSGDPIMREEIITAFVIVAPSFIGPILLGA